MNTIAIVGLGEVGRCFARPLHAAGFRLLLCQSRRSPPVDAMAAETGCAIESAPGPWLAEADFVFSCVTGSAALSVVRACVPHLRKGAVFVDFTTASPETKRAGLQIAEGHGARYVDVAIMGAITLGRVRTPLLASGEGASEFKSVLSQVGARVQVIDGGQAGDAMALKILRSVFTKGMEALCVEMMMSAEKQGLREQVFAQLSDIDDTPLRSFIEMLVKTHVVHAKRRAHEVHDAGEVLLGQQLRSVVLPGVKRRFDLTAAALERSPLGEPEPSYEQAMGWLLKNGVT